MARSRNRFERRRKRLSLVVMVAVIAVLATIAGWGALATSSRQGMSPPRGEVLRLRAEPVLH